jgi:hypothetical protein
MSLQNNIPDDIVHKLSNLPTVAPTSFKSVSDVELLNANSVNNIRSDAYKAISKSYQDIANSAFDARGQIDEVYFNINNIFVKSINNGFHIFSNTRQLKMELGCGIVPMIEYHTQSPGQVMIFFDAVNYMCLESE